MLLSEERIKACVKKWVETIQACLKQCGERGLYSVAFECPECGQIPNGIQHGSMKCGNCKFVIPKEYRPPSRAEIIELAKEEEIMEQFLQTMKRINKTRERLKKIDSWN
jgi:hypothetical protein